MKKRGRDVVYFNSSKTLTGEISKLVHRKKLDRFDRPVVLKRGIVSWMGHDIATTLARRHLNLGWEPHWLCQEP